MRNIKIKAELPLREDGKETRQLIIDCAGKLIAEKGYDKVTSKEICQMAQVNMGAVNYHFGSRDGLYLVVMQEAHDYLMNLEALQKISQSKVSAKEKVEGFFNLYIANVYGEHNWYLAVWAREVLNPTPFLEELLSRNALPKLTVVLDIFSEYTGLAKDDMRLHTCFFSTIAPFALIFLARNNGVNYNKVLPVSYPLPEVFVQLKSFAFAGLEAFKIK